MAKYNLKFTQSGGNEIINKFHKNHFNSFNVGQIFILYLVIKYRCNKNVITILVKINIVPFDIKR